tara:strand:+ start:403 stop:861 length:459 start_codon:yes stop_codon:yes gene_type:complete
MRQRTEATAVAPTLTYLSKTNLTQTVLVVKEAQSYLQEQMATELFEQTTKKDFMSLAESHFLYNSILNDFIAALENPTLDCKIGAFTKMQEYYNFGDIYDAVEDAFCVYLLSFCIDLETYTDKKLKEVFTSMYKESDAIYKELISFMNLNKL